MLSWKGSSDWEPYTVVNFNEQKFNNDVAKAERSINFARGQLEKATQDLTNAKNHLVNKTDHLAKELYSNHLYSDLDQKHIEVYVLSHNENHKAASINASGRDFVKNKQFDQVWLEIDLIQKFHGRIVNIDKKAADIWGLYVVLIIQLLLTV
ncbi:hypothetical protein [Candidatus Phycorickettsia trachydisci]|nr:hypothetical protein [Candidatus Phycorickettsia trachydisci]